MATVNATADDYRVDLLNELVREFDAASGTDAQKRTKAVDLVCAMARFRDLRRQAEEIAAGLSS